MGPMGPWAQVPLRSFKALWAHRPSVLKCLQGPMGPWAKCPQVPSRPYGPYGAQVPFKCPLSALKAFKCL